MVILQEAWSESVDWVYLAQGSHQWRDPRNEISGATRDEEFLDQLRDYKLLTNDVFVIRSIS
jgi:hypothetical protein